MINPGTYTATCIGYKFGKTKGDKQQIACQFQVVEGEERGQTVIWYGYFTAKTWERTCGALRAMGWKGDDLSDLGPLDYKVSIVVEHDTYEGKTRPKVQWVNALGAASIVLNNPMTGDELRRFAAQMKSRAGKVPEVEGESFSDAGNGEGQDPESDKMPWDDQGCSDVNDELGF